jgi:Ca-activated chloride channel family protein
MTAASRWDRGIVFRSLLLVLPLAVAAAPRLLASLTQDEPNFRSTSSELVVLPTRVVDQRGEFVADLDQQRFTIFDNDRPQPIELFSPQDTPVSMALVIDDSGSMRGKIGEALAASMALARASNPDDELFVIEFNDSVRDALGGQSVTAADASALEGALRTLVPRGRTSLYDALLDGIEHVERSRLERKVIVLLSDGGDNASGAVERDVFARARQSSVTIYTVALFSPDDPDANDRVLHRIADATGGERFRPESPGVLIKVCERIARDIRSGYTIAFAPPERDGRFHHVRIKVSTDDKRKLTARTRPGYVASGESP